MQRKCLDFNKVVEKLIITALLRRLPICLVYNHRGAFMKRELSSVLTWTAKKHGIFFYVTGFCFYTSFPSFTWIYFTSATFQRHFVCVFPVIKKKKPETICRKQGSRFTVADQSGSIKRNSHKKYPKISLLNNKDLEGSSPPAPISWILTVHSGLSSLAAPLVVDYIPTPTFPPKTPKWVVLVQ